MGMSYEEYWNGDPWLAKDYRDAYLIKQDENNFTLWLQGFYNHNAVSVVMCNAFKEKGKKAEKYFEKPIELRPKQKTVKEIRQDTYNQLKLLQELWNGRSNKP